MTEDLKKVGMRDKPESQMTMEEMRSFLKPLGLPEAPFPMSVLVKTADKDKNGGFVQEVSAIQSLSGAMLIPSEASVERVYGKMLRECATPQMMTMTRDILMRVQPGSTSRVFAVLGDPATGKSHEFKKIASLIHPQGAMVVDCGGMNMRELFFRTIIDYGKGVREQFDKRVAQGKVDDTNLDALESSFKGSVVRDADGKASSINWSAIGAPRKDETDASKSEDRGAAMFRAKELLTAIYEKEGISVQHNSFGIKTTEGEIITCRREGRPLFLDEFTKCQKETLDAYQNYLDWENGNAHEDTVQIPNTMVTSDGESPLYATLDRRETKMGWILGIAGNESKDGITTHTLSDSMLTRLQPTRIGEPALRDFAHRISQIYTGFPLSTWYSMKEDEAKADPAGFAEEVWALRTCGLSPMEVKSIPPHERLFLKNFDKTIEAINMLAQAYHTTCQLAKPESPLLDKKEFAKAASEIEADYKRISVSLRTPLEHFKKAKKASPVVTPKGKASLKVDFAALKNFNPANIAEPAPAWHTLGANLVRVIEESIQNDTQGMPMTCSALIALWEANGVIPSSLGEGKASDKKKSLSDLLKYDAIADKGLGNTEELTAVRTILAATLRGKDADLKASDDKLIPLENLGLALQTLEELMKTDAKIFVIPNDDISTVSANPVIAAHAIPNYSLPTPANSDDPLKALLDEKRLVDFRSALAALAMPNYDAGNRDKIWPKDLMDHVPEPTDDAGRARSWMPDELEVYKTLKGESELNFDISVMTAASKDGKSSVNMIVFADKIIDKMLVMGPETISATLQSELTKKNVIYVSTSEDGGDKKINNFVSEGLKTRCEMGKIPNDATHVMLSKTLRAMSGLYEMIDAEEDGGDISVDVGATLGSVALKISGEPSIYMAIVKPKALKR